MTLDKLTVRALAARAVVVPMRRPLGTAGGSVSRAPLVLIDLESEEGPVGRSYLFAYTPRALRALVRLLEDLAELVVGEALAPLVLEETLQKNFRLLGAEGLTGMAASGIDMAAWDALAKAAGVPLACLLGGQARAVPAYNSNGLGLIGPDKLGAEAAALLERGFGAIKLRLGYPDADGDLAAVEAVREAVPAETLIMSDYNQSLTPAAAKWRLDRLDDEGLYWVEEPTRFDDFEGHAEIRAAARTPVQTGENCWGVRDMAKALAAGACDYFMADAGKIGGVSGWLRAAALAEPVGLPLSSHLYPEVSQHLLAVTPTRHWLEYVDWAEPILQRPIVIEAGRAQAPERPGIGLDWNEAAVARYLYG